MNRLSRERQMSVISLLVEGNSLRSCERITGVHRDTVMRLAVKVGNACKDMLNARMADLSLEHLQCDEIWTFCFKKQARLNMMERYNDGLGDQYLFIALDETTKLIPSFLLGKRTKENTVQFMTDTARRMRGFGPRPTIDPRRMMDIPEPESHHDAPRISTDGFTPYREAVRTAFYNEAPHGVLIKNYIQTEQPGRYGPPELESATRRVLTFGLDKWSICTSHVERNNLSIRTFMRRFTRLALGFSKKVENLAAAIALHLAHYNFCRFHRGIRSTPAMAAAIAGHPWTMEELFDAVGL